MDKTPTPSDYVNTERGSRNPNISYRGHKEDRIMEEIREFRLEMKALMDEQTKEYKILLNRFINTESELKELRKQMKVLQDKVDNVQVLETKLGDIGHKDEIVEGARVTVGPSINRNAETKVKKGPIRSFAAATKSQNENRVIKNKVSTEECGATKPYNKERIEKSTAVKEINGTENVRNQSDKIVETEELKSQNEGNWITVSKKKSRYPNTDVKKGGSTSAVDIRGTERKKFLHVWRLCKETTVENLEKYVKNICGPLVPVTVEIINHKTERDYASFIIGIPESSYDTLSQSENWPVNIEFCEWVWFRRTTKKP